MPVPDKLICFIVLPLYPVPFTDADMEEYPCTAIPHASIVALVLTMDVVKVAEGTADACAVKVRVDVLVPIVDVPL